MEIKVKKERGPLEKTFLFGILVYLALQGLYPSLERRFFWGELCVLASSVVVLRHVVQHKIQKQILVLVFVWLFIFPLYAVWITLNFWAEEYIFLYMIRGLSLYFYSVFFFIGYKYCDDFLDILSRFWPLALIPFCLLLISGGGIGSSVLICFFFLGISKRIQTLPGFVCGYAVIFLLLFFRCHGGSGVLSALVFVATPLFLRVIHLLQAFRPPFLIKWGLRLLVCAAFGAVLLGSFRFMDFISTLVGAGRSIEAFESMDLIAGADLNVYWRLVLWGYLIGRFWIWPFGIGIGTPLFGNELVNFMNLAMTPDESYVLGAHNSFITCLIRLGLVFVLYFFCVVQRFTKLVSSYVSQMQNKSLWTTTNSRLILVSLSTFAVALVQTNFNVVLETPLYAAFFWFPFGVAVRLVGDRLGDMENKKEVLV